MIAPYPATLSPVDNACDWCAETRHLLCQVRLDLGGNDVSSLVLCAGCRAEIRHALERIRLDGRAIGTGARRRP